MTDNFTVFTTTTGEASKDYRREYQGKCPRGHFFFIGPDEEDPVKQALFKKCREEHEKNPFFHTLPAQRDECNECKQAPNKSSKNTRRTRRNRHHRR